MGGVYNLVSCQPRKGIQASPSFIVIFFFPSRSSFLCVGFLVWLLPRIPLQMQAFPIPRREIDSQRSPQEESSLTFETKGTTRSRVNFFMNRFRKLGFIHYNGELEVHSSLLNVVLHD